MGFSGSGERTSMTDFVDAEEVDLRGYPRKWGRRDVRIRADVEILEKKDRVFTSGTAVIRNISLRGALLGKLKLKKQMLPAKWFRIKVRFQDAGYSGIGALCRPIRFGKGDDFELAVEFDDFWARADGTHTRRMKVKPPRPAKKKK
jgi:hypothetical protein